MGLADPSWPRLAGRAGNGRLKRRCSGRTHRAAARTSPGLLVCGRRVEPLTSASKSP